MAQHGCTARYVCLHVSATVDGVVLNSAVKFYYDDFRTGFKAAQEKARAKGIYRQNYCGCLFSEKEKIEKKKGPVARVQGKK